MRKAQSQGIGSGALAAFPPGGMQCIKMFAPKPKGFGAFSYGGKIASKYQNAEQRCSILYFVKNDMLCSQNGNNSFKLIANI